MQSFFTITTAEEGYHHGGCLATLHPSYALLSRAWQIAWDIQRQLLRYPIIITAIKSSYSVGDAVVKQSIAKGPAKGSTLTNVSSPTSPALPKRYRSDSFPSGHDVTLSEPECDIVRQSPCSYSFFLLFALGSGVIVLQSSKL